MAEKKHEVNPLGATEAKGPTDAKPSGQLIAARQIIENVKLAGFERMKGNERVRIPVDNMFADKYPYLWEYCTFLEAAKQFRVEPPRIVLQIDDGVWKATLSDAALKQSLTDTGLTWDDALSRLNNLVISSEAPWNKWKKRGKGWEDISEEEGGK